MGLLDILAYSTAVASRLKPWCFGGVKAWGISLEYVPAHSASSLGWSTCKQWTLWEGPNSHNKVWYWWQASCFFVGTLTESCIWSLERCRMFCSETLMIEHQAPRSTIFQLTLAISGDERLNGTAWNWAVTTLLELQSLTNCFGNLVDIRPPSSQSNCLRTLSTRFTSTQSYTSSVSLFFFNFKINVLGKNIAMLKRRWDGLAI